MVLDSILAADHEVTIVSVQEVLVTVSLWGDARQPRHRPAGAVARSSLRPGIPPCIVLHVSSEKSVNESGSLVASVTNPRPPSAPPNHAVHEFLLGRACISACVLGTCWRRRGHGARKSAQQWLPSAAGCTTCCIPHKHALTVHHLATGMLKIPSVLKGKRFSNGSPVFAGARESGSVLVASSPVCLRRRRLS